MRSIWDINHSYLWLFKKVQLICKVKISKLEITRFSCIYNSDTNMLPYIKHIILSHDHFMEIFAHMTVFTGIWKYFQFYYFPLYETHYYCFMSDKLMTLLAICFTTTSTKCLDVGGALNLSYWHLSNLKPSSNL